MTAKQYFSDYDDDYLDLSKEEFQKIWEINRKYFVTLLQVCPFPISKEAIDWLLMSSLDIQSFPTQSTN